MNDRESREKKDLQRKSRASGTPLVLTADPEKLLGRHITSCGLKPPPSDFPPPANTQNILCLPISLSWKLWGIIFWS
jgi:hypothetical protein